MAIELLEIVNAFQQLSGVNSGENIYKRKAPQTISWVIEEPFCSGNSVGITGYYEKQLRAVTQKQYIEQKISKYINLSEDWDGYGAFAPTRDVIHNTVCFLNNLPHNLIKQLDEDDDIIPNPNGTLSFEWRFNDDKIFVEIGNASMSIFSLINGRYRSFNNCPISFDGDFSVAYQTINNGLA